MASRLSDAERAVRAYCSSVVSGKRIVGRLERLAVERHLADLAAVKSGERTDIHFDRAAAQDVCEFFPLLKHSKGKWAGQRFEPAPWQLFIAWNVFGWKRADGTRRFRVAYVEVARKAGKTTFSAALGIYLAFFDGEPGAEVYAVAPLALDTPVATSCGWKTIGTIEPGDTVFDERGRPCNVLGASEVFRDRKCFAVRFNDGSSVVTDAEHLWTVDSVELGGSKAGIPRGARPRFGRTITTERLAETVKTSWGATNHSIPAAAPIECPDAALPIPPYTLGVWLGDGRSNRGAIGHDARDTEILREIDAEGFELLLQKHTPAMVNYTAKGLRTALRLNGLLDNKHIPEVYFRASMKQRLALVRGLMDSDGCCTKTGEVRFTNGNRQIAFGVFELLASIGIVPKIHEVVAQGGAPHWIVSCRGASDPLFLTARRACRQVVPTRRARRRFIVGVDPVESVPVRCLSVDSPSHLFLVGKGLIATHNTKKDQARICHAEAVKMSRRVRELGLESGSAPPDKAAAIYSTELGAKFDALGADADTTDGLNVHAAIVDEFHAHKTRDLFDRIDTATGARRQPLILIITTAGDDELSPCYQERERARSMLDATLPDDSLFAFIAAPDDGDDWTSRSTWSKGNPNLGVSVQIDELAEQCAKAKRSPQRQNAFRRFRLNQWTRATTRFIDLGAWDSCAGDVPAKSIEEQMEGRVCYSGLDLSSKTDVTALVHVFPPEEGETEYVIVPRFWLPEEAITSPDRPRSVPYEQWVEEGFLRTTPGNVIDYEQVVQEIEEDAERFRIAEMPFDRWGSQLITPKLEGMGLTVVQFGQGFKMMSDPTKELEALVLSKKIRHGGHPVLRWMADCLEVSTDPAGNIKPVKPDTRKSAKRIDGMVALVMALSRAMLLGASPPQDRSIYDDQDLRIV